LFYNRLYALLLDCSENSFYYQLCGAWYSRVCANSHLKEIVLVLCMTLPV